MRPLIKKWRMEGKRTSLYLDNRILAGVDFQTTKKLATDLLRDMSCAGLMINYEKSNMPSQKASYLGFIIDTQKLLFTAPGEKINSIKTELRNLIIKSLSDTPFSMRTINTELS